MIETYLSTRRALKGVVVILDIRRTPRQEELDLLSWLQHYSITAVLVLTKTDKLSKNKQAQKLNLIAQVLARDKSDFILFSAKSRRGRDALWSAILSLVEIEDPKLSD